MTEKRELTPVYAGNKAVVVVKEEVGFVKNVVRGFAFTLGTVLAFAALAVLFGKKI